MKPINNFKDVQASGDFPRLTEGGYIAVIKGVKDIANKEYLEVAFDIAEGEFKGYYASLEERASFWGGITRRSYKEKALGMFKAFTQAVDKSNGTDFTGAVEKGFDEGQLVGKYFGVVLGWELYDKNNGEEGKRLIVTSVKSVDDIKAGNFTIAETRDARQNKLAAAPVEGFSAIPDNNLPF